MSHTMPLVTIIEIKGVNRGVCAGKSVDHNDNPIICPYIYLSVIF